MNRLIALLALVTWLAGPAPATAAPCPGDVNDDGQVTVDEILVVVNASLVGCLPSPSATPTSAPAMTPTRTATGTRTRTASPTPRFRDNGDGTISDTTTDLMWEKQSDDNGLHDKDRRYNWSVSGSNSPNGDAFAFIATLNSGRFAGHRDWRMPTFEELGTIVDRGVVVPGRPVVPDEFDDDCRPGCSITQCSCTTDLNYWTATPNAADLRQAAFILFNTGEAGFGLKTREFYVRAVRSE